MVLTFVTGPARAGKSRLAERLATATGFAITYVATAPPRLDDPAWVERTAQHAARRPAAWRFVETARLGAPALEAMLSLAGERETIVIDTLPAWLLERAGAATEAAFNGAAESFLAALGTTRAHVIVVGEETGWDAAPADPAARLLRDAAGALQARLAIAAERAYLVVSGFALDLRAQGRPIER
jgi:adenosylcobinamide kinase/adenosylcobinamide-phosphate guanylyltransferase